MKMITLHSPAMRNDGGYVDAGATLTIGDKHDQIDAARAKNLVDRHAAIAETTAKDSVGK